MKFSTLSIHDWQQFSKIDIVFHSRLTILTGANGSGKTTLLRILAQHKGWPSSLVATPRKNAVTGAMEFVARYFKGKEGSQDNRIGTITYSNGAEAALNVPPDNQAVYGIGISNQQDVNCFFVPSHRQTFRYEPLNSIPTTKKSELHAFDEINNLAIQRHYGRQNTSNSALMKNTLIGWVIQGYGVRSPTRVVMAADSVQSGAFEGFQATLKKLLPSSLGFEELEVRGMEIVFVCNGGDDQFLLETASGGVTTIVDLAWQLFMYSRGKPGPFTVIIDEAENHLHPTLQRSLLQSLLDAFPDATFVVSTHSPLIVGSVKDASVYALRYNEHKKIESLKLDLAEKSMTATEILDDVLGVSSSLPIWVENELSSILRDIQLSGSDETTFSRLRARLRAVGLEHLLPEAMTSFLDGTK